MNEIARQENQKVSTHFQVVEGSNYKVIMTYDREEIINFDQFQKLAKVLFSGSTVFVTVNNKIVQLRDIRMVEPTHELTPKQREKREEEKREREEKERLEQKVTDKWQAFERNYFNEKYGEGKWTFYPIPKPMRSKQKEEKLLVQPDERQKAWARFEEQEPETARKLEQIRQNRVDNDK